MILEVKSVVLEDSSIKTLTHKGFVPRAEVCRDKGGSILLDGCKVVEKGNI